MLLLAKNNWVCKLLPTILVDIVKKLLKASTPSLLNGTEFLVIEAIVAVKSKYLKLGLWAPFTPTFIPT